LSNWYNWVNVMDFQSEMVESLVIFSILVAIYSNSYKQSPRDICGQKGAER